MEWAFLLCWLGYWSLDNLNIYTYMMLCFTNNGIIRIDVGQFAYLLDSPRQWILNTSPSVRSLSGCKFKQI